MKKISIISMALVCFAQGYAQNFINKGVIEFEVKTNMKKTMGESPWAEAFMDQIPTYKTAYYKFSFANNKSLYKWSGFNEKEKVPEFLRKDEEEYEYFVDHNTGEMNYKKIVVGANFQIKDSLNAIEWRLSADTREIAGFNCRKATGVIFDSVYVFVFYTEEIPISGGPCSINGLPGMVLGMTIPRLYTSWIATKVDVSGFNESIIQAPPASKKPMKQIEFRNLLVDKSKDWGGGDEDTKKWIQQFLWSSML